MWRHYLLGKNFVLMTNHISLNYFFTQIDLNARQARWLSFLSEFDMEIKHIKGKENKVADALSINSWQSVSNIGSSVNFDIERRIQEVVNQDQNYEKLQAQMLKKEMKGYTHNQKGLICYRDRLYIPDVDSLKKEILDEYHKRPYVG